MSECDRHQIRSVDGVEIEEITTHDGAVRAITARGPEWAIRMPGGGGGGGGKGGGSGARTPVEQPNNIRSAAYARLIYLLGEGEIHNVPATEIYFDENRVFNADGSSNYSNVWVQIHGGTQSQPALPSFPAVEQSNNVGVKVATSTPVTRTINDANADVVMVSIMTPQLQRFEDDGDQVGTFVWFRIELSVNEGAFATYVHTWFNGKTTSPFEKAYYIRLPKPANTWKVRVVRETADSESNTLKNDIYFNSYTVITESKLRYPNSAVMGLIIEAEQFKALPEVAVGIYGLKIKIPSNYNPFTRTYSGVWDGTFQVAWTNNPAWILYDLLTDSRYGAGLAESSVDKWSFYAIAQYCDELVPNGFGGWENRFTCNVTIDTREDAYKVLNAMSSVFRGMLYWGNGNIVATCDRPQDPVRMFTEANVVERVNSDGAIESPTFQYAGASRKAVHTVALVAWSDPDDFYRQKIEYVENREGIQRYGYREKNVTAFGCTSRGQARRVGEWLLYSELNEQETITFSVPRIGMLVRPGEIIKVADPMRAGARMGGRILSATSTEITLDAEVTLNAGESYALSVYDLTTGQVDWQWIQDGPGTYSTLTVPGFSNVPVQHSIWMVESTSFYAQYFRVVGVKENQDENGTTYEITAVAHNPNKFASIEYGWPLTELPISRLPSLLDNPSPPSNLTISELLYETRSGVKTKVLFDWSPSTSPGIDRYTLGYRKLTDTGDFKPITTTDAINAEWRDVEPGEYEFSLQAVNRLGLRSSLITATKEVFGLTTPPVDLTGFQATPVADLARLQWQQHPDLDVRVSGYIVVRYVPTGVEQKWSNGFRIAKVPGNADSVTVPLLDGAFLAKAVDSSGNFSLGTAIATTNYGSIQNLNFVETLTEDPDFTGTKTGVSEVDGVLRLQDNWLIDSLPGDIDDGAENIYDYTPGDRFTTTEGIYEFANAIDLGQVFLSRVTASMSVNVASLSDFWDEQTGTLDEAQGLVFGDAGAGLDELNGDAVLQIATSQNGVDFDSWQDFVVGDYKARALKFRALMEVFDENTNVFISSLSVTVDMPDRVEAGAVTTDAGTAVSVSFTNPFRVVPRLGIAIKDLQVGDRWVISNESESGFDILVMNGGSQVVREIDWIARAYGKQF